ncbi:RDD family protein [Actinomadura parmotrematis]|uniref:RDD family protein n=1 Tax=Actinomadura parmotrematis TaxID=2864039 RepID=A0ABS7G2A0_9ACTN|nr:RDD family protein [Actinomadura parmotrematis]MBW8486846.1 RDD family protein [Actinomadura parmotrematis]
MTDPASPSPPPSGQGPRQGAPQFGTGPQPYVPPFQQPGEQLPPWARGPGQAVVEPAGVGRRVVARVVDGVLLVVAAAGLGTGLAGLLVAVLGKHDTALVVAGATFVPLVAFLGAFEGVQMAVWGRTLGMRMLGIRVARAERPEDGPGAGRAFVRAALWPMVTLPAVLATPGIVALVATASEALYGRGLPVAVRSWALLIVVLVADVFCAVSAVRVLVDRPRHRGLHDQASRTVVVRAADRPAVAQIPVVLAAVALLAVFGVGGGIAAGSGSGGGTSALDPGKPKAPAGGWPQPQNGRVTPDMCGLLTRQDYANFGYSWFGYSNTDVQPPNRVSCLSTGGGGLGVEVLPTRKAAEIRYAQVLRDHKSRLQEDQRRSALATGVVPGTDESWFDNATLGSDSATFKEYDLYARRGALLVSVNLQAWNHKGEKPPKEAAAGLAARVLERLPGVGATDTGTLSKLSFVVVGSRTNRASSISYSDPTSGRSVQLKNVKLPWRVDVDYVPSGASITTFNLTASSPMGTIADLQKGVVCTILLDGKPLKTGGPSSMALCMATVSGS